MNRSRIVRQGLRAAGAAALALFMTPALARADSITLHWTATGDDGTSGKATTYELHFSEQPIAGTDTTSWWNSSGTAGILPAPKTAGTSESYTMSGLATGSTYYFVLKVADEAQNVSYSNLCVRQVGGGSVTLATPEGFTAQAVSGAVDLSWEEPVSGSGSGYHLYRRPAGVGGDSLLATLAVGAVGWSDTGAAGGMAYEYRLATYQGAGEGLPAVAAISVPSDRLLAVSQKIHGYPNPARGKVTLRFSGGTKDGAPGRVRLVIYDLTGHMICQLVDRVLPSGEQAIEWPCRSDKGNAVAPGIYNAILDGPQGRTITRIAIVP